MFPFRTAWIGLCSVVCAMAGAADPVEVSVRWSHDAARPGDQRVLAVVLDVAEGFHINPDVAQISPDSFALPTTLEVEASDTALRIGDIQWPRAHDTASLGGVAPALEGRAVLYVPVTILKDTPSADYTLRLKLSYQACDSRECFLPVDDERTVTLRVSPTTADPGQPDPAVFTDFDPSAFSVGLDGTPSGDDVRFDAFGWSFGVDASSRIGFVMLLIVAAAGGLLLNFTPCVLPVIPIKIMTLAQAASDRSRCFALGVSMSFGVISFWLGLGAIMATVAGFTATNQLFQLPAFTIGVGVLIAVMAASMCGLFTIRLPQRIYAFQPLPATATSAEGRGAPRRHSHAGSFGFGVMTAVLSTPCTAPLMGAAAAWAATRPPSITLVVFFAIGAGMALPYLVLSAAPALVSRIPRAGEASVLLKQVMGLFLLAAAAYFLGVGVSGMTVAPPDPASRAYWWPVGVILAATGAWLAWRTLRITSRPAPRVAFAAIGLTLIALGTGGAHRLASQGPVRWLHYTPERLVAARDRGEVVVMEFTAEWCLNCQAMERTVLHHPDVVAALHAPGVTPIKVDLTGNNTDGNEMLNDTGRVSIPLLVVYAPDGGEVFKSGFYTVDQVTSAIDAAVRSTTGAGVDRSPGSSRDG